MRARHLVRGAALGVIVHALACGGDFGSGGDDCSISLVVIPAQPIRGDTVELTAAVAIDGLTGIEQIAWSIRRGGAEVAYQVAGDSGDEATFVAAEAGVYQILVTGSVGGVACASDSRDLNVTEEGAVIEAMRLVIVPRDPAGPPPQTIDFQLPGGADYTLSTLALDEGAAAAGTVAGPDGEPLAAYLRAAPTGADPSLWIERFTGADGAYDLRLRALPHELLVVPEEEGLPALVLPAAQAADLAGLVSLPAAVTVTGSVRDGAGEPVAGARVQLTIGGAPSTIGVSGAGGAFSLAARAGGPVAVSVVPPAASGLPELLLDGGPAIAGGSQVAVSYGAGLAVRTLSPAIRETDGTTAAAGARLTLVARPIAGAGTIAIDGTAGAAVGQLVRTAEASAAGAVPDQRLTAAVYDLIVEPGPDAGAAQGVRFEALDLRSGQPAPATLRLAPWATLTGQVVDADGAPVEGARLTASAGGLLARASRSGRAAVTAAGGSFSLPVAGRGDYQVRIDGPYGTARGLIAVAAPAPGAGKDTGATRLRRSLRLGGSLVVAGGTPVAGALIELRCLACGPGATPAAVAEAVSDPAGDFTLLAPDPGVAE